MDLGTLGKYQLIKRIAAGGMAEIYVARVTGLPGFEKIVVIKRILPQLATNQEFIQMFLDEARIAATLQHPNIVQMYDIGAADGNYFISMEYLHGEDLRGLLKGLKPHNIWLPIEHALNIVIGISAGLHYAHEKVGFDGRPLGIVHRDVTPQNVFVTYDGSVKIVDFGIAKASNRMKETRYGTLKGKIPYMSPEQCKSEPLDRRSDIYAIGIMLYELTTGVRLYKGASEFEILKRIVDETVTPPTHLRPSFPKDLEPIVLKALAKKREDRYQTARELQADLEQFAREHKLSLSPIALSGFMQKIFPNQLEAWREAQASGKDLSEQIVEKEPEPLDGDDLVEDVEDGAPQVPTTRPVSSIQNTPTATGQVQALDFDSSVRPKPRSNRALVIMAALGMLAAAVIAVVAFGGKKHGDASAKQAAIDAGAPAQLIHATPDAGLPQVAATVPDAGGAGGADAGAAASATGAVHIASHPSGARIAIDGKERPERTPATIDALPVGPHVVLLELPGHKPARTNVTIVAGRTAPVSLELQAATAIVKPPPDVTPPVGPPGELRIASTPSCEVIIDGKSRGSTPLIGLSLPPGKHHVQLLNSRFAIDHTYTVEIKSGEVTKKKWDFPVDK